VGEAPMNTVYAAVVARVCRVRTDLYQTVASIPAG
jgi:hypothetical protein